ncbi:armadillo-type protein [Zopfochytrium polystomum]|nr:armadillo-type protein [Zopfochytrium polystomum]
MQDGQTSSRSVWVGNLDISLSPADLLSVFSPFGPIESLRILPEKECAFVNFVHVEDAVRAKEDMHGVMVGSTVIKLGFGKVESINDHYAVQPTKSLWIGNIPANTDPADLESIFSVFGSVESARVLSHKNCGFVNFDRLEDAIEAKRTMNGHEIGGVVMKIGYAKVPGKGEANYPAQFPQKTGFTAAPQYPSAGPPNTQTVGGVTLRERSQSSPTTGSSSNSSTYSQGNGVGSGKSVATAPQQEAAAPTTPVDAESYAPTLLPLPEPNPNRRVDQNRLREMRKRLEGHPSAKDVETYFQEVFADTVDLCTVLQKIIEKGTDTHLLHLLEAVAPHMATIGVHKNGTWVVQKMIDSAKTPAQMAVVVSAIRPFTPPLLLDQFGNYVVQCCLRLGTQRNQFIFDAMHTKCWDIAQGRFGARAMRACLESQHTTKRQQKHVAISIVQNSVLLVTNPNGALLITWLLDSSSLPGRYRVLAPKLAPIVPSLCTHKLASATILKLINQRVELDARDVIIKELFFRDDLPLREVLSDSVHGVTVIQKILATGCLSTDERVFLADRVRSVLPRVDVKETQAGYKRLLDELSVIPSNVVFGPYINGGGLDGRDPNSNDEAVSPLTPQARSPLDKDGYPVGGFTTPVFYPSPHNSPQPGSVAARVGGVGVALQNTTYHNGFNNSGPTAQAGGSGYLPSPQTSLAATYQTPGRDGRHPQAKGPSFAQY